MQLYPEFALVGSASNGLCYRCRSHERHDAEILDTEIWVEMEGSVQFCRQCVAEMASHFGLVLPEKAQELRDNNRRLGMQLRAEIKGSEALIRQIEALQDQVEALKPLKK